jgi:uncharacterized OB-fold protein
MIAHDITLEYTLNSGWMTPYVDGLRKGEAMARRCATCAKVSFPPVRICDCGGRDGFWEPLSGVAQVTLRTTGQDGDFAMASFEGAGTQTVVKLVNFGPTDTHGRLIAATELPALCLGPKEQETS